jgi:branched-chain amino acid transport system substrate-binding protein
MKAKVVMLGVLALAATLAVTGCAKKNNVIKIGALFNQTGDQSSLDVPGLNGFKLAADEINKAGGLLGKKLEIVAIDGKTDQTQCTNAASKMIDVDKVVAIGGLSDSNYALAAGAIAQAKGVPFVTSGATLPTLPDQVGDAFFLEPFGDNIQAYAGAEFAAKDLKAKTAYILTDKAMDYTITLSKYFKERFTKINGDKSVLLEDTYQTDDVDFSAQIGRLKNLKVQPDVLYVASDPSKCGVIVKQLRALKVKQPVIGGDGYDTPLLVSLGGDAANTGVYFSTHASLTNPADKVQNFVKAYNAAYKTAPENAFAALGYDTMYLIANAIKAGNSDKSADIKAALAKTDGLEGVTGKVSYKNGSRVPTKSVTILTVKDGKFDFVKEVLPE